MLWSRVLVQIEVANNKKDCMAIQAKEQINTLYTTRDMHSESSDITNKSSQ